MILYYEYITDYSLDLCLDYMKHDNILRGGDQYVN